MAWCQFEVDHGLSASRGTVARPFVHRCRRCGFITGATRFEDSKLIFGRECRWFDPQLPGFTVHDPCWCKGLGDVVARVTRLLPEWVAKWCGRQVDRLEAWLTGREQAKYADSGCGGCNRRRVTLNHKYPLTWWRKRFCPPLVTIKEEVGDPIPICFMFNHGFGDAVQFTAVLRHLKKHRPRWRMAMYCKAGAHSLFEGLVDRVGVMDRADLPQVYRDEFALLHGVRWLEPRETYSDSPSTKVERCLREEFGITPEAELLRYQVQVGHGPIMLAYNALAQIAEPCAGRFNVVAIHYQGNSWRESKGIDENIIREVVGLAKARGFVPLILDWEPGFRSSLLKEKVRGVQCFGHDHPIWRGLGVGDGATLVALLQQVALVVGIDSGPEHAAVATDTPTLVCWGRKTHPVNYFCPAPNVEHVIRQDQGKHIFGDRATGETYFRAHYRYHELRYNLRLVLPDLVAAELAKYESHRA